MQEQLLMFIWVGETKAAVKREQWIQTTIHIEKSQEMSPEN